MQIQGSGKIKFENGKIKRAAYSGNNGSLTYL
jgi:membrane-bound lytic murein transglycosylase